MGKTKNEIITDINEFLSECGGLYSDYYVGITNDAERRLFNEHKVDKDHGTWIYCPGKSDDVAREVEEYYIDKGCIGGSGGGDDDSNVVYCYRITSQTVE